MLVYRRYEHCTCDAYTYTRVRSLPVNIGLYINNTSCLLYLLVMRLEVVVNVYVTRVTLDSADRWK